MIFDANIRIGRLAAGGGRSFTTAQDVLRAMDGFGISHALVHHALARESDIRQGNRRLHELIDGCPRLHPCWTVIPHRVDPDILCRELRAHQVRAVRMFPRTGLFSIRPWCQGRFAASLADAGYVLFVDFENVSWSDTGVDWEGIGMLCAALPSLPVVVCGVSAGAPVNCTELLERHANLHLEISQLASTGALQRWVENGKAGQLIFGSDLPVRHAGAPLSMLMRQAFPAAVRAAILGGNLARLLQTEPDPVPSARPSKRTTLKIIDTHVHLGGWNRFASMNGSPENIVTEMNRCGIRRAVITALWSCYGEVAMGNRAVALACKRFPDRLFGYLTLDPKHPVEVAGELKRHANNPVFLGIKAHCGLHGVNIDDPRYHPILRYANRRRWPVLVHAGVETGMWRRLCAAYPRVPFIVAHVGGMAPHADLVFPFADLCRETANLYFDLASSNVYYGFLEALVARAGAEKILFGSDFPLLDMGFELGQILYGDLRTADRVKILTGNARAIFAFPS